jgi:hypothetical protein
MSVNAESDNVESTNETLNKKTEEVAELTATSVDVQKEQLGLLKTISESLAPKTPSEMQEQKGAPVTQKAANDEGAAPTGLSIGDIDIPGRGTSGMLSKMAGKATGMGGKILGGLGKAAKFLGPAAAIAGAAYSGFEGYQNTNANFDVEAGKEATTGQKISSTLGGVASGATFGLLDEKTAAQGIHKAGSYIGEKASDVGNAVSGFFGGIGDKLKGTYSSCIGYKDQPNGVAGPEMLVSSNSSLENKQSYNKAEGESYSRSFKEGITSDKSILGSSFLGSMFTAKGKESGSFLANQEETAKTDELGSTARYSQTLGRRISGGLFGADTYKVTNHKTGDEETVNKYEYNKLKALAKEGKSEEAQRKLEDIVNAKKAAKESVPEVDAMGNVTGAAPTYTGSDVIKASTENADMTRDLTTSKNAPAQSIVSSSVNNNNSTSYVPIKPGPRPEYAGSALDRYQGRVSVY